MIRLILAVCLLSLLGCMESPNNTSEKVDTASALARVASTFRASLKSSKTVNATKEGLSVAMESLAPAKAAFPSPELDRIDEKARALQEAISTGDEAKVKASRLELMKCIDEISPPTN